jgi:Protein of unknown function (DUF664)
MSHTLCSCCREVSAAALDGPVEPVGPLAEVCHQLGRSDLGDLGGDHAQGERRPVERVGVHSYPTPPHIGLRHGRPPAQAGAYLRCRSVHDGLDLVPRPENPDALAHELGGVLRRKFATAELRAVNAEPLDPVQPEAPPAVPAEVIRHEIMAVGQGGATQWADGFRPLPGETVAGLLDRYAAARRTDALLASLPDLGASHPLPEAPWFAPGARWSARRVLLHLIAETSQHAGHTDIIRESLDGAKTMG